LLTINADTDKADENTKEQLLRLVPTYESLASSSKVHLIQSLVSRLLVEHIFDPYFIGLPAEHADELSKAEKYLSTFGRLVDS
jgi:activating signal cointegrator complex subunit 1